MIPLSFQNENGDKIAEKLYTELPETSFTRSISNPEAVMRRRRQQKLERKLQQFRNQDGTYIIAIQIYLSASFIAYPFLLYIKANVFPWPQKMGNLTIF